MTTTRAPLVRGAAFSSRFGLRLPILLAPMAGACPPALSIAVADAGGLGACGALTLEAEAMRAWAAEVRAHTDGPFQMNLWIPDPPPVRDEAHEARVRQFLSAFGPAVPPEAGDAQPPPFAAQLEALLACAPRVASSIMGLFPPAFVARLKAAGIAWFATVTTVAEAKLAEAAGADAIVAQGMEAGGHRGAFDASRAERDLVGTFALLPAVVDAVRVPVVAAGGIADGRGVAAALVLGASAVQIGTGFLRCPEAALAASWAGALAKATPEATMLTRAFSGRAGRSLVTRYVREASAPGAPVPAPYPIQRGLTAAMRTEASLLDDVERMQAWAGQAAALARVEPASALVRSLWSEAADLLGARSWEL
jgi:nitronate monooxygenase